MNIFWTNQLKAAFRRGILPENFWRLSLSEWRALTQTDAQNTPRWQDFASLLQRYPDDNPLRTNPHANTSEPSDFWTEY